MWLRGTAGDPKIASGITTARIRPLEGVYFENTFPLTERGGGLKCRKVLVTNTKTRLADR